MKEINLEEILLDESKQKLGYNSWIDFEEVYKSYSTNFRALQKFVIDFGKRVTREVLELAAENAKAKEVGVEHDDYIIHIINKQSILDTINQIECE